MKEQIKCTDCKYMYWNEKTNDYDCAYANFVGTEECESTFECVDALKPQN